MSNQGLNVDTLFLACTRSSMIAGVTMVAMGINVIVTCLVFILAGNIFYALIGIIFHLILRALCKYAQYVPRAGELPRDERPVPQHEVLGRVVGVTFEGGAALQRARLQPWLAQHDCGLVRTSPTFSSPIPVM